MHGWVVSSIGLAVDLTLVTESWMDVDQDFDNRHDDWIEGGKLVNCPATSLPDDPFLRPCGLYRAVGAAGSRGFAGFAAAISAARPDGHGALRRLRCPFQRRRSAGLFRVSGCPRKRCRACGSCRPGAP